MTTTMLMRVNVNGAERRAVRQMCAELGLDEADLVRLALYRLAFFLDPHADPKLFYVRAGKSTRGPQPEQRV